MRPNIYVYCEEVYDIFFDIEAFVRAVLEIKNIVKGSMSINIVSASSILKMNRYYLGHDYETDVISFNLSTITDPLGDIYICYVVAKDNADFYQQTIDEELKLLIIHGILHVLGYCDERSEDKYQMDKEQERILSILSDLGNYD